jgi:hypothetical protein
MSGGGGTSSSQTQSNQNTLPPWLTSAYQSNLGGAQDLYGADQAQTAGAPALLGQGINSIAGVNPAAIGGADSALSGILGGNYLGGANSTFGAANPQIASEASGSLMSPGSNPYLSGMYTQGLQGIQNNVDSQFGAAGRNVLASAPVQADQASTLANQLYGGQYGTNLNATLGAQQLASGNYNTGINALTGAASVAPGVTQGLYTQGNQQLQAGQAPNSLQSWYTSLLGQTAAPFGQSTSSGSGRTDSTLGTIGTIGGILGLL